MKRLQLGSSYELLKHGRLRTGGGREHVLTLVSCGNNSLFLVCLDRNLCGRSRLFYVMKYLIHLCPLITSLLFPLPPKPSPTPPCTAGARSCISASPLIFVSGLCVWSVEGAVGGCAEEGAGAVEGDRKQSLGKQLIALHPFHPAVLPPRGTSAGWRNGT